MRAFLCSIAFVLATGCSFTGWMPKHPITTTVQLAYEPVHYELWIQRPPPPRQSVTLKVTLKEKLPSNWELYVRNVDDEDGNAGWYPSSVMFSKDTSEASVQLLARAGDRIEVQGMFLKEDEFDRVLPNWLVQNEAHRWNPLTYTDDGPGIDTRIKSITIGDMESPPRIVQDQNGFNASTVVP